jgi:hypothetical protein
MNVPLSGESSSGKTATMNTQQTTLLVIPDTSDGSEFFVLPKTHKRYRRLIASTLGRQLKRQQDWELLCRDRVRICHHAHDTRHIDVSSDVSEFLILLSLGKQLQSTGAKYVGEFHRPHNRNFAQTTNARNIIRTRELKSGSTVGGTEELSI